MITGDRPAIELVLALRRRGYRTTFVPPDRLSSTLRTLAAAQQPVVLCGNARGIDRAALAGDRP
jgi:hypothetical protein